MCLFRLTRFPITLAWFVGACGGSDPIRADHSSPPFSAPREIKEEPSFATDINEVFVRRGCSAEGCHGSVAGGLTLTEDAAHNFAVLVHVAADAEPFERVAPGDADNSYLVIKLEGRQAVGARMPLGAEPLDIVDITNIRNWIDKGAPSN